MRFGQEKRPRPTKTPTSERKFLAALLDRRGQLSEDLSRERNDPVTGHPGVEDSIQSMIAILQEAIENIDQSIQGLLADNQQLGDQDRLFQSVCGVGSVTSWTILAYLGDIS